MEQLLTTKLYIPPLRQEMVSRPRLIQRLNAGLGRKLTLISAPAGFGKTTLLSEWISTFELKNGEHGQMGGEQVRDTQSETHNRVAWLSLDEKDNGPDRFWIYFVAALQTISPELGTRTLTLLESQPLAPHLSMTSSWRREEKKSSHEPSPGRASESDQTEAALTALINEIAATQHDGDDHSLILVLDDYHVIETQAIHAGLTFLLDHLPPAGGLHLVIASRTDPPLPLSRLRSRRQLNELDETDLRFTPDEVSTFLNQVMNLELSAQDVTELEARTEGWVVGLQMAALSLQTKDRTQAAEFVSAFSGSHRYVLDYLTDEVLLQQSQDTQNFLMRTAILDRLCGQLCDAVTGQGNGQLMLEQLDSANLFILPLDDQRHWYRYHHLFADLLRERLARTHPDLVPELHRKASVWYEREG